ncbi:MAG: hypothetical protein HYX25_02085 [Candidatus Solibacter usitatus]|nr:hypothetical protein [Candidatus Solibacter usitatus]
MAQTRGRGWSAAEAARLLEGFDRSGLTRRDYCEQAGIPVTTLDYYRRRKAKQQEAALVPVKVLDSRRSQGFTLVLSNGRRIESSWDFAGEELTRLVRIAEQA